MNTDNKNTMGSRLKQIMDEKGLKQIDIINRTLPFQKKFNVRMSKSDLSQYVNDKVDPRQDKIFLLANALNVNEAWLMGYEVPRERADNKDKVNIVNYQSTYNYFDTGISAGMLTSIDFFTSENTTKIALSDAILGKYAGDSDIFITRINGESMNNVIPNHSMIAVKKYESVSDLRDEDIVIFQSDGEMAVKRFNNFPDSKIISFTPDSKDSSFRPINYRYEDISELNIVGKVVVYTVEL